MYFVDRTILLDAQGGAHNHNLTPAHRETKLVSFYVFSQVKSEKGNMSGTSYDLRF